MRMFNELLAAQAVSLEAASAVPGPEYTGRYLVLLREDASPAKGAEFLSDRNLNVVSTADFEQGILPEEEARRVDGVVFHNIGVALVDAPPEQMAGVAAATATESPIQAVEPERVCYTSDGQPVLDYLRGYRDAVRDLAGRVAGAVAGTAIPASAGAPPPPPFDESGFTWGLQAVRADRSTATGKGIRVAILDTGVFAGHPDFAGRAITTESFITGETADDGHGHGTHCTGTACGPRQAQQPPGFGLAFDAEIFVGKVLNNAGRGGDGGILAGIDWAMQNRCHVISMSLGSRVLQGQPFSTVYERTAQRALSAGSLIMAAAGNDSARPTMVAPVSHPANCPSILAVGAVDRAFHIAPFSNQTINAGGGEVDVAAPGVDVYSTWIAPLLHRRISGTSMATPHVAGVAALVAELTALTGADLWKEVVGACIDIGLSTVDAGAGLVQAP